MIQTKRYLYETHMHTSEASACGKNTGAELAIAHIKAGYAGIIVTDHFFNGNTSIPKSLPWEERVNLFCKGYENAKKAAEPFSFHVFFGWEYNFNGTEFLTYGLDKTFLLSHPDMLSWTPEEYCHRVRKSGGFISHAHPFREASYIPSVRLYPSLVDAVEVYNARNSKPEHNDKALKYAKEYSLFQTAGSDTHHTGEIAGVGMEFFRELSDIRDFITAVRRSEFVLCTGTGS